MKFYFCGGADCPEWVLSEIVLLNQISAVRLRLFVSQIIKKITDITRQEDSRSFEESKAVKYLEQANFNEDQTQSVFSLIDFILTNAACFRVDDAVLLKELQQLGLAIENSEALARPFKSNYDSLVQAQELRMMRVSQIEKLEGKVAYTLGSSELWNVKFDEDKKQKEQQAAAEDEEEGENRSLDTDIPILGTRVDLSIKLKNWPKKHQFSIGGKQFLRMMKELRQVRDTLESINTT